MGKSRKEQWTAFDNDDELKLLLEKCNGAVLNVPRVEPMTINWLRVNRVPLTAVVEDNEFKIADIAAHLRVNTWVRLTEDLIASVMSLASAKSNFKKKDSNQQKVAVVK